jgi:DNA-binding NarL/FixJ family response regulator
MPDMCGSPGAIALVGEWNALRSDEPTVFVGHTAIVRCPARLRALQRTLTTSLFSWLLIGPDQDERIMESLISSARTVSPGSRLAILGDKRDWARCERWLRRGCAVYLDSLSGVDRMMETLRVAADCDVVIADSCFLRELRSCHPVELAARLSKREIDVLRRLAVGHGTKEIASELHLSGNTVEFHVANVLNKLSARNRLEAVYHGRILGL